MQAITLVFKSETCNYQNYFIGRIEVNLTCLYCRYNLDPEGEISDEKLWAALETVQLKESITELHNQLGICLFTSFSKRIILQAILKHA